VGRIATKGGPRGPVPKLAAERRRRNAPTGPALVTVPTVAPATPPNADPSWHEVIIGWFNGLREGPEAEFMTPAGWGFARYLAERESRNLQLARPSAQTSALFVASQADLLTTEGSRRRLRVELDRKPPEVGGVDATLRRWGVIKGGAGGG
jgi:hypothetical protein